MYDTYQMLVGITGTAKELWKEETNEGVVDKYVKTKQDIELAKLYVMNFPLLTKIAHTFNEIDITDKASRSLGCCARAADTFEFDGGSKFHSWLTLCWQRELMTLQSRIIRVKAQIPCENFVYEQDIDYDNGVTGTEQKIVDRLTMEVAETYNDIDFTIGFKNLLDTGIWKRDEKALLIGSYYGMTDKEISKVLGISNTQIYWARKRVQNVLLSNHQLMEMVF